MFSDIKKSQTSEFGLYKYHDCEDNLSIKKRRYRFAIILLLAIIILTSISIIIYNQIADSKPNPIPILNLNDTEVEESRLHVSFSKEIINERNSDAPHALEIRNARPSLERKEGGAPRPFIYEIRDPIPIGFQPDTNRGHRAKNIQEIIKYLTENPPNDNTKVTSGKKLKTTPKRSPFAISDPFFPYKPKNPSDINLLATNGLRFAPTIQIEVKTSTEGYPSYEVPEMPKRAKKKLRKNLRPNPHVNNNAYPYLNPNINPYGNSANGLYSQNNYFQQTRFQANRQHPHWNRPQNFGAQYLGYQHLGPQNLGYQDYSAQNLGFPNVGFQNMGSQNVLTNRYKSRPNSDEQIHPSQMILNLNLYPKKKMKENRIFQENCTTEEIIDSLSTKNITELQKLLKRLNAEPEPQNILQINEYEEPQLQPDLNSFEESPEQTDAPPTYEIFKSIGFTVFNPNSTIKNHISVPFEGQQSQWHPMIMETTDSPEIEDVADYLNETSTQKAENDETATLPMPYEDFERYFTTKPTPKYNTEWDPTILELNPNLVNHNVYYRDKRRRKGLENK